MNVNVVENFLKGKVGNQDLCEDRIVITEHFICIVDGATSKSNFTFSNKSIGTLVGEVIDSAIRKVDHKATSIEFVMYLTNCVKKFYEDNGLLNHMEVSPVDRLSAAICVYSIYRDEIWIVGDCQCLVDGSYYSSSSYIEKINSEVRAIVIELALKEGLTIAQLQENDTGRGFILPILKKQHLFQNAFFANKLSYAVIDGFEVDKNKIYKIDTSNSKSIILASDGYPKLFSTLIESEEYLKNILEIDPLCYSVFKSTKGQYKGNLSFDDRAYLKIIKNE